MSIAILRCPEHIWNHSNDPNEILNASKGRKLKKKTFKR
ncbi:hypothetical protein PBI_SCTP2_329 [Salicola phage SCTP-2]|nr:hypothetical protein PBI_SCTP2_329 [Salicola phage SCTP-2]